MTPDRNKYLDEKAQEWLDNQDGGCNCPNGNPPCSWCVGGYSLSLAEFLLVANDEYTGHDDPHEAYDRAMGVLGDY